MSASVPNPNSTTVTDIPKFAGNDGHDFLMYLQSWRKFADYKNVTNVILYDKDERGASFTESLKPADPRELFIPFWNKNISETKMEVLTTVPIISQDLGLGLG